MSVHLLANIVIGLALVGLFAARQLRWRRVDRASVWRMPLVLGVIGIISLSSTAKSVTVGPLDIGLLAVGLVLSTGVGLLMGRLTTFRVAPVADAKGRRIEARSGGRGAALWIVLIVIRVVLDVVGGLLGAQLLTATGVILLTIAVNRAASALVMDSRLPRIAPTRA